MQTKNNSIIKVSVIGAILSILLAIIYSCGGSKVVKLEGAGATFPYPLYSQLFDTYARSTQVKVNYQSIGSGGGIKQIAERTVDFGATDAFIDDKKLSEINSANDNRLLHIPVVLGGVSITYNLKRANDLKLDGKTLAAIFMGKIKMWDDPAIASLNPGADLPALEIIVVRRSDGSGTTSALSSYLAHISPEWKSKVGVGKSLDWFQGSIGAKGNEGVTGQIQNIPSSIGYVSLNYAIENSLPVIAIKNSFGNFITPDVESVSLSGNTDIPDDTRIDLTVLEGDPQGYPISTFTWIVFYQEQSYSDRTEDQARTLKEMLSWIISPEAQKEAAPLYYAPLPDSVVRKAQAVIDTITFDGSRL